MKPQKENLYRLLSNQEVLRRVADANQCYPDEKVAEAAIEFYLEELFGMTLDFDNVQQILAEIMLKHRRMREE